MESSLLKLALKKEGLEQVAKKVIDGEKLSKAEIKGLYAAPLPVLAKLVELTTSHTEVSIRSKELEKNSDTYFHLLPEDADDFIEQLCNLSDLSTWVAITPSKLDSLDLSSSKPLGFQVLKYIAIARIVLGNSVRICAPFNLLGENLSTLAISYGANDLGYIKEEQQDQLRKELSKHSHLGLKISNI